ncbi:MAG TPA: carboxypeptidase-like regulatory domain-containing protein, partial [Vicinamibacterales bacterium]|nr:carboxypeptidase-like regulatory domain-containing protein [Vicinamibacterales bacterium]
MALAVALSTGASAQDMPDPSLIHGRAIPAPELANGTVTVRVVREAIGNNAPGQQVSVTVGGTTRSATTDAQGRAEFAGLPAGGTNALAEVTVDGEKLVSQPFAVPTSGGLRVILVAGIAKAAERKKQEEAAAAAEPPTKGIVIFGGNSRVLMQFNNDALDVYYILEIVNSARTRVDFGAPLVIELPPGVSGATALEGSSKLATVSEDRITITGPLPSGTTMLQTAFRMPYDDANLTLTQKWP